MKKTNQLPKCKPTSKQKLYGILGLIAFFVCGVMAGYALHSGNRAVCVRPMCDCADAAECENDKVVADVAKSDADKPACAIIEEIQTKWLHDENSPDYREHETNLRVYETLFQYGCDENKAKYRDAISREMLILESMGVESHESNASTCKRIEDLLLRERMPYADDSVDRRIERAQVYANLSERGCPENSQKFVDLAKQELDIARALKDDRFYDDDRNTIEVVETYKRLNMQAAAEEFFDVAKKLTNPAIDFILEVEKIINEK